MDYGKNNTYPKYYFNKLIFVFSLIPCIVIVLAVTLLFGNTTKKQIAASVKGNMNSWTGSLGESLYELEKLYGNELLYSYDALDSYFREIRIQDIESSYCYVTDAEGTMLYHPTKDKVGNSTENEVIMDLVTRIKKGEHPETECAEYKFKGATKYASYFVASDNSFIFVITADEAEVLEPADAIVHVGIMIAVIGVVLFAVLSLIFVKTSSKSR